MKLQGRDTRKAGSHLCPHCIHSPNEQFSDFAGDAYRCPICSTEWCICCLQKHSFGVKGSHGLVRDCSAHVLEQNVMAASPRGEGKSSLCGGQETEDKEVTRGQK